jgi:hypothetical protein
MNTHRMGLTIAGLVTGVAIAAAFVADGFVNAQTAQRAAETASQSASAGATATLDPEIVYVRPAPSPRIINVTETATPDATQQVIHVVVPGGGEHEDNEVDD